MIVPGYEARSGTISRKYLLRIIEERLRSKSSRVLNKDPTNQGYHIGKALGYSDALKDCAELIRSLPDNDE